MDLRTSGDREKIFEGYREFSKLFGRKARLSNKNLSSKFRSSGNSCPNIAI